MAKSLIRFFGWIFLILGILGFFANPLIGSGAWWHADLNHNLVHLVTGIILLWVGYKAVAKSAGTLKVFGIVYFLVGLLGILLVDGTGTLLGLVEVNGVANWLHLIIGIILFFGAKNGAGAPRMEARQPEMNTESQGQEPGM